MTGGGVGAIRKEEDRRIEADSDQAESAARTGEGGERVVTRKRRATRLYAAFERIDSMVVTRAGNRWPVESRMHGARVGRARGTSVHDTGT